MNKWQYRATKTNMTTNTAVSIIKQALEQKLFVPTGAVLTKKSPLAHSVSDLKFVTTTTATSQATVNGKTITRKVERDEHGNIVYVEYEISWQRAKYELWVML